MKSCDLPWLLVRHSRTIMRTIHLFIYFAAVIIVLSNIGFYSGNFMHFPTIEDQKIQNKTIVVKLMKPAGEAARFNHRKLRSQGVCTKWDISISQSRNPTPGIPQYIVEIVNTCVSTDCAPSNIHLHCGWFASARMVNPRTFKRLSFDDCLLNGGLPLKNSQSIRFTYANSFMYPLAFKSANFC